MTSHVMDISDPANPRLLSRIRSGAGLFDGSHLFTQDGQVFDLADPRCPRKVSEIRSPQGAPGGGRYMARACSFLYYADSDRGQSFQVVDVSNPAWPVVTGTCEVGRRKESIQNLVVRRDFAFVSLTDSVAVVDVRNPY